MTITTHTINRISATTPIDTPTARPTISVPEVDTTASVDGITPVRGVSEVSDAVVDANAVVDADAVVESGFEYTKKKIRLVHGTYTPPLPALYLDCRCH